MSTWWARMLKLLVFSLDNLSSNNPWELHIVHRLLGMVYTAFLSLLKVRPRNCYIT